MGAEKVLKLGTVSILISFGIEKVLNGRRWKARIVRIDWNYIEKIVVRLLIRKISDKSRAWREGMTEAKAVSETLPARPSGNTRTL